MGKDTWVLNTGCGTVSKKNPLKNEFIEGWEQDNDMIYVIGKRSNGNIVVVAGYYGKENREAGTEMYGKVGGHVFPVSSQANRELGIWTILDYAYDAQELSQKLPSTATLYSFD